MGGSDAGFIGANHPTEGKTMRDDQHKFLMVHGKVPARLTIEQAAWLLGFHEHDISVLVSAGLLKPLGHPPASGSKYFAAVELEALRADVRWLAKASDAVVNYWRTKNAGRRGRQSSGSQVVGQPGGGQ